MRRSTALVRIRFPHDLVERLDRLADTFRSHGRRVPRAAIVRALVEVNMSASTSALAEVLRIDPVKRGREKGPRRAMAPAA